MLLASHVLIAATGLLRKFGSLHIAPAETHDCFSIRTSVRRRLSGTVSHQPMISYSRFVSGILWQIDLRCINQPCRADRLHLAPRVFTTTFSIVALMSHTKTELF